MLSKHEKQNQFVPLLSILPARFGGVLINNTVNCNDYVASVIYEWTTTKHWWNLVYKISIQRCWAFVGFITIGNMKAILRGVYGITHKHIQWNYIIFWKVGKICYRVTEYTICNPGLNVNYCLIQQRPQHVQSQHAMND